MEKASPARKVRVESLASSIRRADRERLSPFEMTVASRCCGGALIKAMNKRAQCGPEHGCLPIHPPLRVEPRCDIGRAEPAIVMLLCEISNDHIRFPKPHVTIIDGRDEAVPIHGDILPGVGHPEITFSIDPFIIPA